LAEVHGCLPASFFSRPRGSGDGVARSVVIRDDRWTSEAGLTALLGKPKAFFPNWTPRKSKHRDFNERHRSLCEPASILNVMQTLRPNAGCGEPHHLSRYHPTADRRNRIRDPNGLLEVGDHRRANSSSHNTNSHRISRIMSSTWAQLYALSSVFSGLRFPRNWSHSIPWVIIATITWVLSFLLCLKLDCR
jgi:hypothetical protein